MESYQLSVSGEGNEPKTNVWPVYKLPSGGSCDSLCVDAGDCVCCDWSFGIAVDSEGVCEGKVEDIEIERESAKASYHSLALSCLSGLSCVLSFYRRM